jgi:hypothetical protein
MVDQNSKKDENKIKGATGTKIKVLFYGLHMTHVLFLC